MSFRVAQKTLESLEWPAVVARLRANCRTPQARARLAGEDPQEPSAEWQEPSAKTQEPSAEPEDSVAAGASTAPGDREQTAARPYDQFAPTLEEARERLAETSEARALLDADEICPLGGALDLEPAFLRAEKGGTLAPQQLLDVRATLVALHETRNFARRNTENAPRLAALAALTGDHGDLEREIEWSIDPAAEVRDEASTALRDARRESNQLAGDLQRRLERYLHDEDVSASLSDTFYTVRNDRYVLPVRADARGSVRGIVHDASRSGTTLFIEPEAVVELNNRLKQAELTAAREVERVLRALSARVADAAPELRQDLETLADLDLAFARAHVSREMRAVAPRIEPDGVFHLTQLRHPLLAVDDAVPNDLHLGEGFHVLVISGPNAGGKTVALKSLGLAALFVRAGLHVPADPGARVALVDAVLADIGDGQDMSESLSTFSAHMVRLAEIVQRASPDTLALLDEVGVGTDPGEGAALGQSVLENLADTGVRVVATTHYNLLKEMAAVDPRFCNASVEFDPETLAPTYRLHVGTPGISSATAVAARMGMPQPVLDRANALLDREDRRLDRMLSELGASRAALEREQREVEALRAESETIRDDYRTKLERLQERRDKLFHSMRDDLDRAFREAHGEVASVIRDLQRGGGARDAAQARKRLQDLETKAREAEEQTGVDRDAAPQGDTVDWRHAKPGDAVEIAGGGRGSLESLPDTKGRVRVKVGSATLVLPADRVRAGETSPPPEAPSHKRIRVISAEGGDLAEDRGLHGGGTMHCDLRGLRVAEALERVADTLDRALADARHEIEFIHGLGTGALRQAVREELGTSPHVVEIRSGDPDHGGEGITYARLGR